MLNQSSAPKTKSAYILQSIVTIPNIIKHFFWKLHESSRCVPLACHTILLTRHAILVSYHYWEEDFRNGSNIAAKETAVVDWSKTSLVWMKCLILVDTGDILITTSLWRICFAIQMMWKTLIFLLMMNVSLIADSDSLWILLLFGVWLKKEDKSCSQVLPKIDEFFHNRRNKRSTLPENIPY